MNETYLNIDLLIPYPNHPFPLYKGKRMDDMIESIREHGIISPIIVRPAEDGKYEILSGHNRVEAAKSLELTEVPAVVKEDLNDDEAALLVTESNLIQRSFADLRHSERAVTLKNHLEALKKSNGKDNKRNSLLDFFEEQGAQVAHRQKSRDKVADKYALSKDTVMRYVRLAKLPKALLKKVDDDKLKFIPAVELSWLSDNELNELEKILESNEVKISLNHAKHLRQESEIAEGTLTLENILSILNKKSSKIVSQKINLSDEIVERLDSYGKYSDKIIANILSIYLDMLERGEVQDVFENGNGTAEE
jgi:ParB family chromosome partitioning protein